MTPYSSRACIVRVSLSRGSSQRKGSGIGTWNTTICPSTSGVSGTRWRVWMMLAAAVRVVVRTPVVVSKNRRMLTALVVSSAPWSMTLRTSAAPITLAVTWMPPVPHPYGSGISRLPKGTWWPGIATALRRARRIIRFVCSSR